MEQRRTYGENGCESIEMGLRRRLGRHQSWCALDGRKTLEHVGKNTQPGQTRSTEGTTGIVGPCPFRLWIAGYDGRYIHVQQHCEDRRSDGPDRPENRSKLQSWCRSHR